MRPLGDAGVRRFASRALGLIALAALVTGSSSCGSSRSRAVPTVKPTDQHAVTTRATEPVAAPAGSSTAPAMTITEMRSPGGAVVGIARINQRRARVSLFGGSHDPGQGSDGQVPQTERPTLLAAFNGGFLLRQSHGGLYFHGRTYKPLLPGVASVVVRRDGTAVVGTWDRDLTMTPDVVAVRQNLTLLVDRSAPVAGLVANNAKFGATIGHRAAVSRSGLCSAGDDTLVYAAGRDLTAADLAQVLAAAGCVRAMELDINPQYVVFVAYRHVGSNLVGARLVPTMHYGPERFLNPQPRDFFAVFSR